MSLDLPGQPLEPVRDAEFLPLRRRKPCNAVAAVNLHAEWLVRAYTDLVRLLMHTSQLFVAVNRLLCVVGLGLLTSRAALAQQSPMPLHLFPTPPGVPLDANGFLFNPVWRGQDSIFPNIDVICRFRAATGHLEERTLMTTRKRCLSTEERERPLVVRIQPSSSGARRPTARGGCHVVTC